MLPTAKLMSSTKWYNQIHPGLFNCQNTWGSANIAFIKLVSFILSGSANIAAWINGTRDERRTNVTKFHKVQTSLLKDAPCTNFFSFSTSDFARSKAYYTMSSRSEKLGLNKQQHDVSITIVQLVSFKLSSFLVVLFHNYKNPSVGVDTISMIGDLNLDSAKSTKTEVKLTQAFSPIHFLVATIRPHDDLIYLWTIYTVPFSGVFHNL
jgi:hypothetical protein